MTFHASFLAVNLILKALYTPGEALSGVKCRCGNTGSGVAAVFLFCVTLHWFGGGVSCLLIGSDNELLRCLVALHLCGFCFFFFP